MGQRLLYGLATKTYPRGNSHNLSGRNLPQTDLLYIHNRLSTSALLCREKAFFCVR